MSVSWRDERIARIFPGPATPAPGHRQNVTTGFRADIQALRAIAVVAVVLFHLWPGAVPGGYVGVDVFFVISGFLIHSQLMGEFDRTGTVDLPKFWARRIKRLQPAALLVLAVTVAGIVLFVPRSSWIQFLQEVIASALQVENWLLGLNSVDYLASGNNPSPTQHYWTLSVEEQFYVGFPLVLLAGLAFARRSGRAARRSVAVAIGIVALASFAFSLWQTWTTPSIAYFSTFTRAWEFALGALLSMWGVTPARRLGSAAAMLGIAAIVVACLHYGAATRFPGYAALLPVIGAMLCLWAGRGSLLEAAGRVRIVSLLGRYSYSIYLWHWPLIILAPQVLGEPPGFAWRVGIALLTFFLAMLSTHCVEDPIRFSPRLLGGNRRKRVIAAYSVASLLLVLTAAFAPLYAESIRQASLPATPGQMVSSGTSPGARPIAGRADGVPSVNGFPPCFGAQAMDKAYAPCTNRELGDEVFPDPAVAKKDIANRPACWNLEKDGDRARVCSLGPTEGYEKRLYALGDSHSNALLDVYEAIARNNNWRIDASGHVGCYVTTAEQQQPSKKHRESCRKWRASVLEIAGSGYDAFLVTHASTIREVIPVDGKSKEQTTIDGMVEAWNLLPDVPIIAIRDNPGMHGDVVDCVARGGAAAAVACSRKRSEALAFDGQKEAALQVGRAKVVDLTDFYCNQTDCPAVIGNVLVYRDRNHTTGTYTKTLIPYFEREIEAALRE